MIEPPHHKTTLHSQGKRHKLNSHTEIFKKKKNPEEIHTVQMTMLPTIKTASSALHDPLMENTYRVEFFYSVWPQQASFIVKFFPF